MPARRYVWIFVFAILVHTTWAGLLLLHPSPGNATPVHQTVVAFGRYPAAAIFLVGAALAAIALFVQLDGWSSWLLLPQQAILLAAMTGGLHAVIAGQYADGVPRPWEFILADQLPVIMATLIHSYAVLRTLLHPDTGR